MKAFRFKNKPQTNTYTIYTLIAVALSISIFSGLNLYINKQVAYLLVTILSSISIYSAIKKAGKEFEEIMIQESDIKFYFQNKMKEPISIPKTKISVKLVSDILEFENKETKKIIGQAHKNKLENEGDWEVLISSTL
jgi:hypothetical protein